jgi:lipopolysaccharide transport system ATP-binding protein
MRAITLDHVTKEFQLGQAGSLRQTVSRAFAHVRGRHAPRTARFKALDDVNLHVEDGEVLGIIGSNGAGKSTMLKLLARITVPTSGRVAVRGRIAPLIEVGAGLIGDLSGRENIYLNGIILGMSHARIRKKFDEIVAFSELADFIDTPIKRYSSGMAVRLGFSIATCVDADILIVDEVLAVGDLAFQRKCFDRMEDMIKRQGKTVLLVSHNTRQIERLCSRVILFDHGRIIADDSPSTVCRLFHERSDEKIRLNSESQSQRTANAPGSDEVHVLDVAVLDARGNAGSMVTFRSDLAVRLRFRVMKELKVPTFGMGVHTTDFLYLSTYNSEQELHIERLLPGTYEMLCRIRRSPLLPGVYAVRLGITEGIAAREVFYAENLVHFQVVADAASPIAPANRHGFFALEASWAPPREVDPIPLASVSSEITPVP